MINVLIYFILFEFVVANIILIVLFKKNYNIIRKKRKIIPQHKHSIKVPTWKFQKFKKSECKHNNGIYRKIKYKKFEESLEKTIFVCADCISVIEIDKLKN